VTARVLIMAGGQGERMRAGGVDIPKPLVPVGGIPLLERNLLAVLQAGFHDITVAVPARAPDIAAFVSRRCRPLGASFGAQVHLFEETHPLGNIGAAAEIETQGHDLLVIYADNLTSLDLNALVAHHRDARTVLTSAVHYQPFQIPFGQVEVEGGRIRAYLEKPVHRILVSSGIFVLSPRAIRHLPPGKAASVSGLVNSLLQAEEPVSAFAHDAAWIDVNDPNAVERAEQLLAERPGVFELQATPAGGQP
jgi:NDP-mannose synthase